MACFVDVEFHLFAVEVDRAVFKSARTQQFCQAVEGEDFRSEVA